jgi:hypothetical protein
VLNLHRLTLSFIEAAAIVGHLTKCPPVSSSAAGLSKMKNEVPSSCDSESFAYWSYSFTAGTAGIAIQSL